MDPSCSCQHCELKELFVDNLEGDTLDIVCTGKVEKDYRQGEVIIKEGTKIQDFTYLKTGLVKLFRRDNSGKEQIIALAKPMDYVSLLSERYNNNKIPYLKAAINGLRSNKAARKSNNYSSMVFVAQQK